VLVTATLSELTGPTRGVVQLPHRLMWQAPELRRFDLADRHDRAWLYEIVLREAVRPADLRTYLDGTTLCELWPRLYLPRGVRRAWAERHPVLDRAALAA
jgi:hypothetical protein